MAESKSKETKDPADARQPDQSQGGNADAGNRAQKQQAKDGPKQPETPEEKQARGEDIQAGNAVTNPAAGGDAAPTIAQVKAGAQKQPGKQDIPKDQPEGEINASTWTDEEGYEFDLTDGSDEYREKLHKDGKI